MHAALLCSPYSITIAEQSLLAVSAVGCATVPSCYNQTNLWMSFLCEIGLVVLVSLWSRFIAAI